MSTADTTGVPDTTGRDKQDDLATLAKGGRTNVLGFMLRLGARIPFLLVAGRLYGADTLGRFALAVLVVEFAAQIATLGLKRGLAEQLSARSRPDNHVVYDALLLTVMASAVASAALIAFPGAMFPNSAINGLDRLLPLIIFGIAIADVALAACAYRYDIGATVRARSIVEPWAISIAASALFFYSPRDGLILAYVVSMTSAFLTAIWALLRHYGLPKGWQPQPMQLWTMTRRNLPLAAADAIEWGTRRLDLWILGFFVSPTAAGIYYVAQQFSSLPQKLKTSFEPILGPIISRNVAERKYGAVAEHVSQVGFWIIAAQVGIALAIGIPGEAVMGVLGPQFVAGTGALIFLLAAEATSAPSVVAEAALVYLARGRNLWLSIATIALQAGLSLALVIGARHLALPEMWVAACPALGLAVALAAGSWIKSRALSHIVQAPVTSWRPSLFLAGGLAGAAGGAFTLLPRSLEWAELLLGIPAIILTYSLVIWRVGFGPADRELFRRGAKPSPAPACYQGPDGG
ncbi:lipopolysaccharide biosynthesis protein [Sphingobium sufflavum]|uniref:lipopolysaccharide biosynthesis protein n=1 Tax=Sphingobium sufflavum TaxID=1129547 RepID=UPI001F415D92|nr:lipopolysaccharide biosynthesis protein [Sphingobium sufflavum]MCE7795663.1 lipopolysaccharide biosynthesis protein [Sphingobium sufflavum]